MKLSLKILFLFITINGISQPEQYPKMWIKKHQGPVKSVVFDPSSKYILTGSSDKSLIVWDIENQKELLTITGHVGEVKDICIGINDNRIYTAADRFIRVWDWTGKLQMTTGGTSTYLWNISLHPNENVVTAGSFDPVVNIWPLNIKNKKTEKIRHHNKSVLVSKFSPDGKLIATGSQDKTICIWTVDSLKLITCFQGHSESITDIEWFPGNNHLISSSADSYIRLWDIENKKCSRIFEGHSKSIASIAISPDTLFILSGSADQMVNLWEVKTGNLIYQYAAHKGVINDLAFSNNKKLFAVASDDGTASIWDYNPYILIDKYFYNEIQNFKNLNPIFKEKQKNEEKVAFMIRQELAKKTLDSLYQHMYEDYLNNKSK